MDQSTGYYQSSLPYKHAVKPSAFLIYCVTSDLSVFVLMTCLNGYFPDPALVLLAESLVKQGQGGAVAAWGSSLTMAYEQSLMNQEVYRLLFHTGSRGLTPGEAVQQARQAVIDMDIRRSWIQLGDPIMKLR